MDELVKGLALFRQDLESYRRYVQEPPNIFYKNDAEKAACIKKWKCRIKALEYLLFKDNAFVIPETTERSN